MSDDEYDNPSPPEEIPDEDMPWITNELTIISKTPREKQKQEGNKMTYLVTKEV